MIEIRKLKGEELDAVPGLVRETMNHCADPARRPFGAQLLLEDVSTPETFGGMTTWGCFTGEGLAAILTTDEDGRRIRLLITRSDLRRQGYAKALLQSVLLSSMAEEITFAVPPCALKVCAALGFQPAEPAEDRSPAPEGFRLMSIRPKDLRCCHCQKAAEGTCNGEEENNLCMM